MDMYGYPNERPIKMRMTGRVQSPQGSSEVFDIDSTYSMALFDDNPDLQNMRWAFEVMLVIDYLDVFLPKYS